MPIARNSTTKIDKDEHHILKIMIIEYGRQKFSFIFTYFTSEKRLQLELHVNYKQFNTQIMDVTVYTQKGIEKVIQHLMSECIKDANTRINT